VEWVIDIADESSGWFYGTAYHFDDTTRMIHVMVPDKHNPTFDGHVLLDYRTVHLIECVDGKTDALFNKIVRESIIKIRWYVSVYLFEMVSCCLLPRLLLSTALSLSSPLDPAFAVPELTASLPLAPQGAQVVRRGRGRVGEEGTADGGGGGGRLLGEQRWTLLHSHRQPAVGRR